MSAKVSSTRYRPRVDANKHTGLVTQQVWRFFFGVSYLVMYLKIIVSFKEISYCRAQFYNRLYLRYLNSSIHVSYKNFSTQQYYDVFSDASDILLASLEGI